MAKVVNVAMHEEASAQKSRRVDVEMHIAAPIEETGAPTSSLVHGSDKAGLLSFVRQIHNSGGIVHFHVHKHFSK